MSTRHSNYLCFLIVFYAVVKVLTLVSKDQQLMMFHIPKC